MVTHGSQRVKLGAPADWAKKPQVGAKANFWGLFILLVESDQLHEINYILTCEWYAVKDIIHADELQWKWFCEKRIFASQNLSYFIFNHDVGVQC